MVKEEKFKAIQFIRELIIYIDKMLENFPKRDLEISRLIKEESYQMLKYAYLANTTSDLKYRQRNLEEIIARVKLLDFFVNISFDKQIINQKKYLKVGERLDDIIRYVTGWLNATIELEKRNNIQNNI